MEDENDQPVCPAIKITSCAHHPLFNNTEFDYPLSFFGCWMLELGIWEYMKITRRYFRDGEEDVGYCGMRTRTAIQQAKALLAWAQKVDPVYLNLTIATLAELLDELARDEKAFAQLSAAGDSGRATPASEREKIFRELWGDNQPLSTKEGYGSGIFYYLPWPPKEPGTPVRWALAPYLERQTPYPLTHLNVWTDSVVRMLADAWSFSSEHRSEIYWAKDGLPRGRIMTEYVGDQRRYVVYHGGDAPVSFAQLKAEVMASFGLPDGTEWEEHPHEMMSKAQRELVWQTLGLPRQ